MTTGVRLASLFLTYGAIGFGGDYVVELMGRQARNQESFVITVDARADIDVRVDPEVVAGVRTRRGGECEYEIDRELTVSVSAGSTLSVNAGSGELRIEGRQGLDEIQAVGRVCASHEEFLDDLQITAEMVGQNVVLSAHYPETWGWRGNRTARIDLTIAMPLGMELDVDDSSGSMVISGSGELRIDDSSGSMRVSGINGSLSIDDSSGDIVVEDVAGDVEIRDGSGGIDVRDVRGTVSLRDGSGGIDVAEVERDVIVEDDGSGSIDVRAVGGDFIVRDDGSGGIRHRDVGGAVQIPRDKQRRRRGN